MPPSRKNKKNNNNSNNSDDEAEAEYMKKLYPRLNLSFEKAKEWLIDHLASDIFKGREDAGDTVSSIPILQEIVKHNMITENSQEGVI